MWGRLACFRNSTQRLAKQQKAIEALQQLALQTLTKAPQILPLLLPPLPPLPPLGKRRSQPKKKLGLRKARQERESDQLALSMKIRQVQKPETNESAYEFA
jgi:hypothetical protein